MRNFKNDVYEALVQDLINDAFYLQARSRRGVIATIRAYTEVIVRRILDLEENEKVTLGDKKIKDAIKLRSNNNILLISALNNINLFGNRCTHTQELNKITDEEVKNVINSLFEVYSYLFIDYFKKHKFGSNNYIMSSFSILPPIIRYITLEYLYNEYPDNLAIIDKLVLALLKAFDFEVANEWLEGRKEELRLMPTISKSAENEIEKKFGKEKLVVIKSNAPANMYVLCKDRLNEVNLTIQKHGKAYEDFESAMPLYHEKGIVKGNSIESNFLFSFFIRPK